MMVSSGWLLWMWTLLAPEPSLQGCSEPPFQEGEMVRFVVSALGLRGGEATAILRRARPPEPEETLSKALPNEDFWYLEGRAGITPPLSWFYRLDDTVQVWMFPRSMLPHRRELHINETSEVAFQRILFDHRNATSYFYRDRTHWSGNPKYIRVTDRQSFLVPQAFDSASVFLYLRCVDVEPGDRLKLFVTENDKNRMVRIWVKGLETVDSIFGRIEAIRSEITVYPKGKLVKGRPFVGWISNDHRKAPLKFVVDMKYARLKGELAGYRRHFTAPIQGQLDPSNLVGIGDPVPKASKAESSTSPEPPSRRSQLPRAAKKENR